MMICKHAFGDKRYEGHYYEATDAMVGVKVVKYPSGSGFAVVIELADGSSQVFIDGLELDCEDVGTDVMMLWKAPDDAEAKRDQHYVDLKTKVRADELRRETLTRE